MVEYIVILSTIGGVLVICFVIALLIAGLIWLWKYRSIKKGAEIESDEILKKVKGGIDYGKIEKEEGRGARERQGSGTGYGRSYYRPRDPGKSRGSEVSPKQRRGVSVQPSDTDSRTQPSPKRTDRSSKRDWAEFRGDR